MTYNEKNSKFVYQQLNEKSNIVKFDKKHEYCDASFYYGNNIKTSRKILTKILGKPDHVGHDECEWNSSSVEWWKMLKLSNNDIIPFKIYDYGSDTLEDENAIIYWRIGTEHNKKKEQEIVKNTLLKIINTFNN